MRKKFFAFVLIAILLSVFAPEKICAENKLEEAESRMLNDLLAYIYKREIICSDMKWILDSFERFDREKTWESLQIARAIVAIAKTDINKCRLPALEMTEDDKKILINHKIDAAALSNLGLIFDAEKTLYINTSAGLNNNIMRDVFFRDDWAICMRHVSIINKFIDCNIKYLADMADLFLTYINKPVTTEKFNNLLAKYCPKTHAYQRKTPDTIENIEADIQKVLDQFELLTMDKAKIVGANQHKLNLMKDAIEKKNLELFKQNLMTISNMPPLIFSPEWFSDSEIFYFWSENDQVLPTPSPRSEITRLPDICQVKINGVSRDKVKQYHQELNNNGFKSLLVKEEADKYTIFYKIQESSFAIIWEAEQVTILMYENPVCFVPILYLSLMK